MKASLTKKIAIPFAFLLFLMATMLVTSYFAQDMDTATIETLRLETQKQTMAAAIQVHFTKMLLAANNFMATGKTKSKAEYKRERDSLRSKLNLLRSKSLTIAERSHLDSLAVDVGSVEAFADSILNSHPVAEQRIASLSEQMNYGYGEKASVQLADFNEATIEKMNAASDEMLVVDRKEFWYTVIPFGIAIPLAFVVVLLTMRRISRPLMNLVHMAERITSRDFSATLTVESEDEIGILVRAFNAMADEIKLRYDELESFAHMVAHDLKNPITGIRGMTEMTLSDAGEALNAEDRENLTFVLQACDSMVALIHDLLDFAQAGKIEFAPVQIPLNTILDDVKRDMLFYIRERNAEIVIASELPSLYCDPIRFSQIWKNLLSNALKYNDSPHPRVEITCDSSHPRSHTFEVKDNGIGLDEKDYEMIFQPFKRAQTTGRYEGTGVGLAIVKRVVDFHGGRVWVTSEKGKGTTFHITLPKVFAASAV
jgi:signal transduction histidine kinase